MADAPIVLKAHEADATFAGELRGFCQRKLTLRLGKASFENPAHRLRVAAPCGLPPSLRRAERLHMNVTDVCLGQAGGKHMLGEASPARIGDLAHIHERPDFRRLQRRHKIRNADAFVADGPDAAHCR